MEEMNEQQCGKRAQWGLQEMLSFLNMGQIWLMDDLGYTCLFKAQALQTNLIKNKYQYGSC